MVSIQAQSIGTPLAGWFAQVSETDARVTARFDSTLHAQSDRGPLWALTTHANAGAHRIVVPSLPNWPVGENVRVHAGSIVSDGVVIRWDAGALWDPRPHRRALSAAERAAAVRRLAHLLQAELCSDAHGFWDWLADHWSSFHAALRQRDELALRAHVAQWIGRGPGLTPAGDDFLQALLVTLHSGDDADRQTFQVLADVIVPLLSRTTPFSRMFLQEALHGWAFGPLKALLDTLPSVTSALGSDLLRVGASSGSAYGLGVLMGVNGPGVLRLREFHGRRGRDGDCVCGDALLDGDFVAQKPSPDGSCNRSASLCGRVYFSLGASLVSANAREYNSRAETLQIG